MKLTLNHEALTAVAEFASKDPTRYILNGVAIKVGEVSGKKARVVMIATDGRALVLLRDPNSEASDLPKTPPKTIVIPTGTLGLWKRLGMVDDDGQVVAKVTLDPVTLTTQTADIIKHQRVSITTEGLLGDYPEWQKCLPGGDVSPVGKPTFDAEMLGRFHGIAAYLQREGKPGISLRSFGDDHGTHLVTSYGDAGANFVGLLMPMRIEYRQIAMPDWLNGYRR